MNVQILKEYVSYNPTNGKFICIKTSGSRKIGKTAGCKTTNGYLVFQIKGTLYLAHRLAWLYMTGKWPDNHIDHINFKKDDNSWKNLRGVNQTENNQHLQIKKTNKSGTTGVWKPKNYKKWLAEIIHNKKRHYLGSFNLKKDAIIARKTAELDLRGTIDA